MKRLIAAALLALALAACSSGGPNASDGTTVKGSTFVGYTHDAEHHVSCWTAYQKAISCLPDSEVFQP